MMMGDRIKSKRTLGNARYPTGNEDQPTGGQPAPAEASRVDSEQTQETPFDQNGRRHIVIDRTSFRSE